MTGNKSVDANRHEDVIERFGPRDRIILASEITDVVSQILEWRQRSSPTAGLVNQPEKNFEARMALMLCSSLINSLCGWAIRHVAGTTINWGPDGVDMPSDVHGAEAAGWAFESGNIPRTPEMSRRVYAAVIPLLLSGCRTFPTDELRQALEALDFGEVRAIVAPAPPRRGRHARSFTLVHLRIQALSHLEFFRGTGQTEQAARDCVADFYGASAETVKWWRRQIPPALRAHYHRLVDAGRQYGKHYSRLLMLSNPRGFDMRMAHDIDATWGETGARIHGQFYRTTLREGKK